MIYTKLSNPIRETRVLKLVFITIPCLKFWAQSPKLKRVSLNETPEFRFWGLDICVDFDLRDSKKMENINKVKKIIFYYKNFYIHKTT